MLTNFNILSAQKTEFCGLEPVDNLSVSGGIMVEVNKDSVPEVANKRGAGRHKYGRGK